MPGKATKKKSTSHLVKLVQYRPAKTAYRPPDGSRSIMESEPLIERNPDFVHVVLHSASVFSAMHVVLPADKVPKDVMGIFIRCPCIIDVEDLVKQNPCPFDSSDKKKLRGFMHMIRLGYAVYAAEMGPVYTEAKCEEEEKMYKRLPRNITSFYDEIRPQVLPNNTLAVVFCSTYRPWDTNNPTEMDKKVVGGWLKEEATPEERDEFVDTYLSETYARKV